MPDEKAPERMCLYNQDGAKIFTGEEAIEAAFDDGYVDHPDKVDAAAESPADIAMDNTKAEILAYAAERGIEVDENDAKADLLAVIAAAEAA